MRRRSVFRGIRLPLRKTRRRLVPIAPLLQKHAVPYARRNRGLFFMKEYRKKIIPEKDSEKQTPPAENRAKGSSKAVFVNVRSVASEIVRKQPECCISQNGQEAEALGVRSFAETTECVPGNPTQTMPAKRARPSGDFPGRPSAFCRRTKTGREISAKRSVWRRSGHP